MKTLQEERFDIIRTFCEDNADAMLVAKYARYFKEGYDAWGLSQTAMIQQIKLWKAEWTDWQFDDYMLLGNRLFATGKYEEAGFAILFAESFKKQFNHQTFSNIALWLQQYVRNWAHSDVICSELLKPLFIKKIISDSDFGEWIKSSSSWQRRAVPVAFIQAIKNGYHVSDLLIVIDPLMLDTTREVQQGLGWFLREAWKLYPFETEPFLLKWKDYCGRLIIQYATEKMTKEYKVRFRKK
jgi:3-methyladenine DNA glycosylase AlkD